MEGDTMSEQKSGLLVNLLKKAVGLPVSNSSCCTATTAKSESACCGTEKPAPSEPCCK